MNWFRKGAHGEYLWPGFSDNVRVLKWVFERVKGADNAQETSIGYLPKPESLDKTGLTIKQESMDQLLAVDPHQWWNELEEIKGYFGVFGDRIPKGIMEELQILEDKITQLKK